MDEQNLLSRLRHGDEQALAAAITQDISASTATAITLRCACTVTHAISCLPCAITQLSKSHE